MNVMEAYVAGVSDAKLLELKAGNFVLSQMVFIEAECEKRGL